MDEYFIAIKAVGDWELDVLAIPFGSRDSDGQWFDDRTDIMHESFTTPLVVYQHGIKQGMEAIDEKPSVIGKSISGTLVKKVDGWHIKVVLDKAKDEAKRVMDAVKSGMVAVSSGTMAHLARLDIGGKLIQWEKNRAGRIAVWALGEISLWEKGSGNAKPANNFAVALPAMKAMYRDAGLPFPEIDTHGVIPKAEISAGKRAKVLEKSKEILKKGKSNENFARTIK